MNRFKLLFCAAVSSLSLAACSTTETWSPSERSAALGGAIGAAAGAAIAKDDVEGALIGGALGPAIGYYSGCKEQGGCFVGGRQVAGQSDLIYDRHGRRYYFLDRSDGRTYWDNGDFRG